MGVITINQHDVAFVAQGVIIGLLMKNHVGSTIAAAQIMVPWRDPQGTRSMTNPKWNPVTKDWDYPWLTEFLNKELPGDGEPPDVT